MAPTAGVGHTLTQDFNDVNLIKLSLRRSSTDNGLLVYRQDSIGGNPLLDITLSQNAASGATFIKVNEDVSGIVAGDRIIGISSLSVHPATANGPAGINTVASVNTGNKRINLVSLVFIYLINGIF